MPKFFADISGQADLGERREGSREREEKKINEGGACRLIRNDVSVNRHINFQSILFPFFSLLSFGCFSIHDTYFVCDVVQLELVVGA
jgi:hypothetical protein